MARLYADENFPFPALLTLRELGHDVTAMVESDLAGQAVPDEQVLALSTGQKRVLLTLNRRDFIRLHSSSVEHAGIIVCTFDADFSALGERIHEALTEHPSMTGQLIRVNRPPQPH